MVVSPKKRKGKKSLKDLIFVEEMKRTKKELPFHASSGNLICKHEKIWMTMKSTIPHVEKYLYAIATDGSIH